MNFDQSLEKKLKNVVVKYLKKGRPNWDLPHTLATVYWAKRLLENNEGKPKIVIPASYLHDIGYSNMFDVSEYNLEKNRELKAGHLEKGAIISETILNSIEGFEKREVKEIVNIVRTHDICSQSKTQNEQLVFEADCLAQIDTKRIKPTFSKEDFLFYLKDAIEWKAKFFKTDSGRELLEQLLEIARGYFD